jgi:hypothetical protein
MLTGEVKQRLVQVLTELVERHRTARANVTEEVHSKLITSFFSINRQSSPQSLERHDIEILNIFKNTKSSSSSSFCFTTLVLHMNEFGNNSAFMGD